MDEHDAETGQPVLVRDHVALTAGVMTLTGRLTIQPGEVRFEPDTGPQIVQHEQLVEIRKSVLGPLGMSTAVVLGRDPVTHEPLLLRGGRRETGSVVAALTAAGFDVRVKWRLL